MEVPSHLNPLASELLVMEQNAAERRGMWAVILGLAPRRDGNQWCLLWGDDLQTGVAGFGNTPDEAINDFERAMFK